LRQDWEKTVQNTEHNIVKLDNTPLAAIQVATPQALPAASKSVDSCVAHTDQIPTLDGWRALAVLGVIAYHSLANGLRPGWIGYGLAVRGYAGVNVFFALKKNTLI
jgi:hypothetical protein